MKLYVKILGKSEYVFTINDLLLNKEFIFCLEKENKKYEKILAKTLASLSNKKSKIIIFIKSEFKFFNRWKTKPKKFFLRNITI